MQMSEAIRRDGHPRWFVLTGFLHDLGKVLCLYGEPQWAVVGDTFPVGCAYSDQIVFPEFFAANPDSKVAEYQTKYGIYEPNCGLDKVYLSWGHDEYVYQVTRKYMPEEAQYMLRYHSFYPAHRHGAYKHLMNAQDEKMFGWVNKFNPYDLYSKGGDRPVAAGSQAPITKIWWRNSSPGSDRLVVPLVGPNNRGLLAAWDRSISSPHTRQ